MPSDIDHGQALSDLLASSSPLEWAFENLTHIDSGTAASVFEHPSAPGLVVRVSEYPDGWFKYACDILDREDNEGVSPYAPRVEWAVETGGVFVGVSERLSPIDEATDLGSIVAVIIERLRRGREEEPVDLEDRCPGISRFLAELDLRLDARPENFMHRNGVVVFNDPYASISYHMENGIRQRLACPAADSPMSRPSY